MLVAIHQLHYLPWLRYFEKIARADVFIALDDAQFTKNDWQNRNKVKTASGVTVLTVPVMHRLGQRLDETLINNETPWRRKHWDTIRQGYARAPFFEQYDAALSPIYAREWTRLNDLNRALLDVLLDALDIRSRVVYSSALGVGGKATERLISLVRAVGGHAYYCGAYAAEQYLDRSLFEKAGIELVVQQWRALEYPQLHGPFVPDLAIVDLLMNCGPGSCEVLLGSKT